MSEARAGGHQGELHLALYTDSPYVGGAEVSLGHLLSELDPAIRVTVLGVARQVVEALVERRTGAESETLPPVRSKLDARSFLAHLAALRRLRPQIFHANLATPASGRYGLLAAQLTRNVRTVAVEQLPYPLSGPLQRRLKRFTSHRLAAHVAVGKQAALTIESLVGLPPGSVRTIYNGVPEFEIEPHVGRSGRLVVGSVGRLDRQKGYDVLLRALDRVPEAELVLVGDGPERRSLEELAERLALTDRVQFAGWDADPKRHLAGVDVFVLPSRFEGFPLAIVEAMLARLPVVATEVGSVPEAVLPERTGTLVPTDDPAALASALKRLLADEPLRRRLGEAGRAFALERFTAAEMARAFEQLYAEILA